MKTGFAVLFACREAKTRNGDIMTAEGAPAWLTESEGYWWGKTYRTPLVDRHNLPEDVVVFATSGEAHQQFKEGMEHIGPWYSAPRNLLEVVAVRQKFKQVPDGYEEAK